MALVIIQILRIIKEIRRIKWIKLNDLAKNTIIVIVVSSISAVILYFENALAGLVFKILRYLFF